MALDFSVYEREGSSKWYVSYYCVESFKRVHKATPWRVDDLAGKKHAMRFGATMAKKASAYRANSSKETWSAWVDPYLATRYNGANRAKTLKRALNAWDWLRVFLAEKGISHPQGVDYNTILNYVEWRQQQKRHCGKLISRNTALTEVKIFGVIMGEAVRRGFCTQNPCLKLGIDRDPSPEKPEITDDEIAIIRERLKAKEGDLPLVERWMTITFELALHHGMRLSETQIPFSAIDLRAGTIRITAKGKNGRSKVFTVLIHPAVKQLLTDLRAAGAHTTCKHPKMAAKDWHTFFHAEERTAHLCFHCTRVTVVTRLARAGVPIQQALAYVGHASETIHRIYTRLKAPDLTSCAAALSYS